MARRRYRRYRKRHGRWSANIKEINRSITVPSTGGAEENEFSTFEQLCINPVQNTNTVSQVFIAKNFNIDFVLEAGSNSQDKAYIENVTAYIMYVPQGLSITNNFNLEHPEYILSYKYLGSPTTYQSLTDETQNYQPFRIRSRMARKLQTGDKIVLYIKGLTQDAQVNRALRLTGLLRWWSKAV